jgi:hypothetical protein
MDVIDNVEALVNLLLCVATLKSHPPFEPSAHKSRGEVAISKKVEGRRVVVKRSTKRGERVVEKSGAR